MDLEKNSKKNIIIYNTSDGKAAVSLYAKDGMIWMNQNQLSELFATSKQNISQHIISILEDKELEKNSVVKNYLTTASDVRTRYSEFDKRRKSFEAKQADILDLEELKQLKEKINTKN